MIGTLRYNEKRVTWVRPLRLVSRSIPSLSSLTPYVVWLRVQKASIVTLVIDKAFITTVRVMLFHHHHHHLLLLLLLIIIILIILCINRTKIRQPILTMSKVRRVAFHVRVVPHISITRKPSVRPIKWPSPPTHPLHPIARFTSHTSLHLPLLHQLPLILLLVVLLLLLSRKMVVLVMQVRWQTHVVEVTSSPPKAPTRVRRVIR